MHHILKSKINKEGQMFVIWHSKEQDVYLCYKISHRFTFVI